MIFFGVKPSRMKKNLKQIHGKVADKINPTTLDQIWGDRGLSKYKTMNAAEYEKYLNELNKSDLQSHAVTHGVLPQDSRERMIKTLMGMFREYVNSFKRPENTIPAPKPISQAASKILAEGR